MLPQLSCQGRRAIDSSMVADQRVNSGVRAAVKYGRGTHPCATGCLRSPAQPQQIVRWSRSNRTTREQGLADPERGWDHQSQSWKHLQQC